MIDDDDDDDDVVWASKYAICRIKSFFFFFLPLRHDYESHYSDTYAPVQNTLLHADLALER